MRAHSARGMGRAGGLSAAALVAYACSSVDVPVLQSSGDAGAGLALGSSDSGGAGVSCSPCQDFPSAPLYDGAATASVAGRFGASTSGAPSGGPCLVEPEIGALFPQNWLRPRFVYQPPAGDDLFELRLHAAREANDLVVYTTNTTWTMPKAMWTSLAAHVDNEPIEVRVRSLASADPAALPKLGTTGTITVAPVSAQGSMVYWATAAFDSNAQNTRLSGFHVGDESVALALSTSQVRQKVRATWGQSLSALSTQVQCIGCHTSTPDGAYAAFTAQWPWPNALASVQGSTVGATPDYLTPQAISNLSPNVNGAYTVPDVQKVMLGIQTFSKAHYAPGDRIVVTTMGSSWYRQNPQDPGMATGVVAQLVWFDLEATSAAQGIAWGVIARNGDPNSAAAPNWSHAGDTIAYASTDTGAEDGRMGQGHSDIALVPYASRAGGQVTALEGASDPSYEEYYPAFSADDSLVAFNRVPQGLSMYAQKAAEVFVVPAAGGQAVRLKANDPAACSGKTSPGVQNTWPKWAPSAERGPDGKTYHWLVFSSTRAGSGNAQLYITAVVQDGAAIETYPSIYLWNQDPSVNNLIPAWDVFQIPPLPIQ